MPAKSNIVLMVLTVAVLLFALNERSPSTDGDGQANGQDLRLAAIKIRDYSDKSFNEFMPSWFGRLQAMGIAISEMKYGAKGHIGYRAIYEVLFPALQGSDAGMPLIEINRGIETTLGLTSVSHRGVYYATNTSVGLVDFFKLSFYLFGFKTESVFYLYSLILLVSIFIFFTSFYDRPELLFLSLLFACGFLVITRTPGLVYLTLTHTRFFPILTLIPALHLAIFIAEKRREFSFKKLVAAIAQTTLLLFAIKARTVGEDQIIFLFVFFGILLLKNLIKKRRPLLKEVSFWPLCVLLAGMILQQAHMRATLDSFYLTDSGKYAVWHMIYLGLSAHPDALAKYNMPELTDSVGLNLAIRKRAEAGKPISYNNMVSDFMAGRVAEGDFVLAGDEYHQILRDEFFRILRNDSRFVIESYLIKFPIYFKTFFSSEPQLVPSTGYLDGYNQLTRWYIFVLVTFGAIFSRAFLLKQWPSLLFIITVQFAITLIPPILSMPTGHATQVSGLVLSMFLYLIYSLLICYLLKSALQLKSRMTDQRN